MQFELLKTEKTMVDIDLSKAYNTVIKELNVKPSDYDEHDDYAYVVCDYFSCNLEQFLKELFNINLTYTEDEPYYDVDINEIQLDKICEAFENYVYNKEYEYAD